MSDINSKIKMSNTQLQYSIDEETQRISIKVIDQDTDKVIREIPPEETLEAIKKIWEIAGIIVDKKL
jgi:flagellar protein FlaG